MSPSRPDPLDIIYEDDETDEGAISYDGGTSLHGHPDHEHADEDMRALVAENALLRENVTALVREVACADTEMVRWRSRCRKIEDERDAISRELDRYKAELERRHTHSQSMVVYSTAENGSAQEQQLYRPGTSDVALSPPQRFASPRLHNVSSSAGQQYTFHSLPAIAVSPTRSPTPPGTGIPTHRGRLAPPRTSPSPGRQGREREPRHVMSQWEPEQNQMQERGRSRSTWEQSRVEMESSQRHRSEKAQRGAAQFQRELEQAQHDWEHVHHSQEHEPNSAPVVYSTGAPDGWSYFDMPHQGEGWDSVQSQSLAPGSRSSLLSSPVGSPLVYSSAYPHPNGHGQGRHVREDIGPPGRVAGRQDATVLTIPQAQQNTHARGQPQPQPQTQHHSTSEHVEPRRTPANDSVATAASTSNPAPSPGSISSGSHDAPQGDPQTPPDPAPAPTTFIFSPTSAAFSPAAGLRGYSSHVLSPTSPPFQPQTSVVDPEFGPVIVHGPLPPRHAQTGNAQAPVQAPQRRKREPVAVPPRHLASGKGAGGGLFGGAAFSGAAMGMGGGVALALGGQGTEGEGVWAWGRR